MASTVGHSLIGLALGAARCLPSAPGWRGLARQAWRRRGWLLLCVALANAPDIDYLFGLARGHFNFYHQQATHTLVWIVLAALGVWLAIRLFPPRAGGDAEEDALRRMMGSARGLLFILAVAGSHLAADFFTTDRSPPVGVPLAWPLAAGHWHSPLPLFPAPAKSSWADLWSRHNLGVMAAEMALTLPPLLAVLLWKLRRTGASGVSSGADGGGWSASHTF